MPIYDKSATNCLQAKPGCIALESCMASRPAEQACIACVGKLIPTGTWTLVMTSRMRVRNLGLSITTTWIRTARYSLVTAWMR